MAVQYTPAQYANFQKAVTPYLLHRHVFFLDILKSHLVEFWKKHYKNVFCDCKCCQFAYLCYRNLATKTTVPEYHCITVECKCEILSEYCMGNWYFYLYHSSYLCQGSVIVLQWPQIFVCIYGISFIWYASNSKWYILYRMFNQICTV